MSSRRTFIAQIGAGVTSLAAAVPEAAMGAPDTDAVDFRYAPLDGQTTFCFPDDSYKSLVGTGGELRYGHPGTNVNIDAFSSIVRFSVAGMETDHVVKQELESPGVPIVRTLIERPRVQLELIAFASNRAEEGRVDNVLVQIRTRAEDELHAAPLVKVATRGRLEAVPLSRAGTRVIGEEGETFLVADQPLLLYPSFDGYVLASPALECHRDSPTRLFVRFPQQRQAVDLVVKGLNEPDVLLAEARDYWSAWRPFGGDVQWRLPRQSQDFLIACARNIQQAREIKNGRKTFQVGPTCYRGLWIVDGNFILEASRYLGYDAEAQQGLEATWSRQLPDGGIFASAPGEHWKDTAIAAFTLVRQAELSCDWSYFRRMVPNILKAFDFLRQVRDRARTENSANGRYGLLGRGFADGGLGGIRSEFSNTVWTLAGLRAVLGAAGKLGMTDEFASVRQFDDELRMAFFHAAKQEMRRDPDGFDYLPMLMKEDPAWQAPNPWDRPRPQVGQWALSHAIYPGLVFDPNDPIVRGHIALMQACTKEDVPAETGWLPHDSLWTYNAPFVSHVYLWAREHAWAARTFNGFLNHASPLYCWREEQPLRGGLVSGYWGDMPHNWASAECILYLRHMYALEDGARLRLLAGVSDLEDAELRQTPTRFGRLNLKLNKSAGGRVRLEFSRSSGPAPAEIELPASLAGRFAFASASGAKFEQRAGSIFVDSTARAFTAEWKV